MATTVTKKCQCCKQPMQVRAADVKRGWGRFCSKSCKAKKQEARTGQYAAHKYARYDYERSGPQYLSEDDDTHPFSDEALGQN